MPTISLTSPTALTVITAGLHATNYAALQALLNGGLDNANISPTAAVDYSKINVPAGAIDVSKLSAPWQSYVPVWSGSATAPVLNNGTITGKYVQIGKTVHVKILLTMGSTTTFGTGNWTLTLPVAPSTLYMATLILFDSSAGTVYPGFARNSPALLLTMASPAAVISATAPFTWASADTLELYATYEAA